jgi:signal transduction histidine kinase
MRGNRGPGCEGGMVKWAVGVVCLVGAVAVAPIPTDHLVGVILLCAALMLSSRAVQTPGGFLFSSFPIPVLVAASVPEVGPWWALAGIVLDTALSLGRSLENRSEYFFRSSLAVVGCAATLFATKSYFIQGEGDLIDFRGLAAYCVGALLFGMSRRDNLPKDKVEDPEDRLLRLRAQRALRPLNVGQLFAGFFPFYFAQLGDWPILVMFLPLLSLFELAAENIVFRVKAEMAEKALQEVADTRAERLETRRALDQSDQERRLLEQLTRAMRDIKSEREGVARLISFVNDVLPDAAVAFFPLVMKKDRQVLDRPIGGRGLQASEIASLASLARTADRDGRLIHRSRPNDSIYVLAAPVLGYGVFCALREDDPYTETEAHIFEQICRRGKDLLAAAKQREKERGQQLKLMSQVELLDVLSRTGRQLFDAKNRNEILQQFIVGLGRLVPHSFGLLRCRDWIVHWDSDLVPSHAEPDSYEGRLALNLRLPPDSDISARYLSNKFFQEHHIYNFHSGLLLAIPFEGQRNEEFVLLGSESPTGYGQEHRDLISTLVGQMVSALLKSERLEALQGALEELAEKQNQLIQSSKMTALGTMVAGVAHEINTPLGAIALSVEAAQMQVERKPKQANKKLTVALEAAEKIRKLVDRLLVFSRKSGNEHSASMASADHKETVKLIDVLQESEAITTAELRQRGVPLAIEAEHDVCVKGTQSELTQVVMNLLLNAAAATVDQYPKGEKPPVTLGCGRVKDRKGMVYLSVADCGTGMDEETVKRIFEPFFTTKPVGVGTGLGLSIAHEIVTAHGGEVQVESKPGKGTKFSLLIPELKKK